MPVPPAAIARRRIVAKFFGADAVRPDDAIEFEPRRFIQQRVFEKFLDAGIIKQAPGGKFWLDVPEYGAYRRSLRKRAMIAVGIAIGAGAAILASAG